MKKTLARHSLQVGSLGISKWERELSFLPFLLCTSPSLPLESVEVAADVQWGGGVMKWRCSGVTKDQQALFKSNHLMACTPPHSLLFKLIDSHLHCFASELVFQHLNLKQHLSYLSAGPRTDRPTNAKMAREGESVSLSTCECECFREQPRVCANEREARGDELKCF